MSIGGVAATGHRHAQFRIRDGVLAESPPPNVVVATGAAEDEAFRVRSRHALAERRHGPSDSNPASNGTAWRRLSWCA